MTAKRQRHPVDIWPTNLELAKEVMPEGMTVTTYVNVAVLEKSQKLAKSAHPTKDTIEKVEE